MTEDGKKGRFFFASTVSQQNCMFRFQRTIVKWVTLAKIVTSLLIFPKGLSSFFDIQIILF